MTAQSQVFASAAQGEPRVLVTHRHTTVKVGLETIFHEHGLGIVRSADQSPGPSGLATAPDEVDVIITDFNHNPSHLLTEDRSLLVVVESESASTWARVLNEGAGGLICLSWSPAAIALSVRVAHAGLAVVSSQIVRETTSPNVQNAPNVLGRG